jgi:hypothetical protein
MQPTQFMPSQTHPHPHQNMFIQEQMQPMYFNQAYPINLAGSLQNSNNFFNHQQNDYDHYQFQQPNEFYSNNQYMNNLNSNKYDAQPLQPPKMVTPRLNNNNNNNNINATKNNSNKKNIDYDSPDSDDNVDQELTNEFTTLKVIDKNSNKNNNNNNNNNNDTSDEDLKRQEVWNKLQNANRKETKSNGSQSKMNGLPPVVSSKSVIKQQQQHQQQKPSQSVMEQKRMEANFLEKNVEAIKNKENLTHRYPEKKYEAFYGKNMGARVKNFQK